jgi:hypothetical protein
LKNANKYQVYVFVVLHFSNVDAICSNNPDEVKEFEFDKQWNYEFIRPDEIPGEPMSDIIYPVINRIDSVYTVNDEYDPTKHKVVATVITSFFWRELISSALPPGHVGLVVVFENPCNPSFTYEIK